MVKRHADAAGLDRDAFAGHSLQAGFLNSAAGAGADVLRMMEVLRTGKSRRSRATWGGQACSRGTLGQGSCSHVDLRCYSSIPDCA